MHAAQAGFGPILEAHLRAAGASDDLPVIICGMAGARQGWVEAGYVDLPAPLDAILTGAVSVPGQTRDVRILPGLAQRRTQAPDVMRGEETQLLGALTAFGEGAHRVCMPGTHSKWVEVDGDTVQGFSTYMTGELFDVVTRHSILSHAVVSDGFDDNRFGAAVLEAWEKPADISNLLFRARAGQLLHGLPADAARAQISGHLIGLEIAGALEQDDEGVVVRLVASGRLQTLYEAAFATLSIACTTIDADEAVRRGLHAAAVSIWPLTR